MTQTVKATYYIESPYSLNYTAEVMAGEQSTGTFTSVPGETDEIKEKFRAKVVDITSLEAVTRSSLPGAKVPYVPPLDSLLHPPGLITTFNRGIVVLEFPLSNFGPSIPNLLATIAGNLYELRELSGIRLIDVDLPVEFLTRYKGPQFGVAGTRQLIGVDQRPIVGTIIKPSIGLDEAALRLLIRELCEAELDFIKDDELNANPPYMPLKQRAKIVMEEIGKMEDKTGRSVMYACNITGDVDELQANYEDLLKAGGNCAMVSVNSIGMTGVAYVRSFSELPIHGHRNGWGAMTRCPELGMGFRVYQKLCRLVGVDHLHTNGLENKFYESNESVTEAAKDCLTPMLGGLEVMPVLSSGQWAARAFDSYEALGTTDVMHLAGGGILAHPDGPRAGVLSMRYSWEAALEGLTLEQATQKHPEIARAVEKFGRKG